LASRSRTPIVALRLGALLVASALAAGCSEGQPVDAGGERGGGALAFVLLAVFAGLFVASLFLMERIRRRGDGGN
jgi:hypothetical protein